MDWTGGTRRRFAVCKRNAQFHRQKAHFANLRTTTNFLSGSSKHFEPNFLDEAELKQARHTQEWLKKAEKKIETHRSLNVNTKPSSRTAWTSSIHTGPTQQSKTNSPVQSQRNVKTLPHQLHSSSSSHRHGNDFVHDVPDENDLIEQRRRHLLAQRDWLGLQVSQPLRMQFPLSRDTEGIGKRRRVYRPSSPKGSTILRRAVTPLFQKRPSSSRYMMHGALQDDGQVRIRIGSVSSSEANTKSSSMPRSLSGMPDDSDSLSEESMLLEPDEDLQFLDVPNWRPTAEQGLYPASNMESWLEMAGASGVTPQVEESPQRSQTALADEMNTVAAVYSSSDDFTSCRPTRI